MVLRTHVFRLSMVLFLTGLNAAGFGSRPVCGAEVKEMTVSRQDNTYHVTFDAIVDAPARKVYRLLSDYVHLDRFSPVIIAITVHPTPQGTGPRVRSVLKSCFLVFCKEVVEVEEVTQSDEQTIAARIVPDAGDFHDGYSRWRIEAVGSRTRLHYEATRTPSFWIPPLLGSWMIKATMRKHLESSTTRLERVINENASFRQKSTAQPS